MLINDKNIKLWSTLGMRATFGLSAIELAKEIDNLIILTADVSTSAGLDRFKKSFPDKYLDLGISEQNLIGVASGLASEDFNVITTTFAPFQTMRCCEQIKVNLGYMQNKVCLVGLASGLVLGSLGFTHCAIEDIGVLRSIPNITIISPADSLETIKAIAAAINHKNSTYVRLTGGANNKSVYTKDYNFEIGKAVTIKEGSDIALFCSGSIVADCLEAAIKLEEKKISCAVINMHTIKPIDYSIIEHSAKNFKLLISVEEHNVIGGLGSAISEQLSNLNSSPKLIRLGINDYYEKGGSYQYLKERYGLSVNKIIETIEKNFKN